MMLALCTAVTFFRLLARAYSKANFTMRRLPVSEIILRLMPESVLTLLPLVSLTSSISLAASGVPSSNSMPA